jgi:hypothetical protein
MRQVVDKLRSSGFVTCNEMEAHESLWLDHIVTDQLAGLGKRLTILEMQFTDPDGTLSKIGGRIFSLENRRTGESIKRDGKAFRDFGAVAAWVQTFKDKDLFRYCDDMVTLIMLCADPYKTIAEGMATAAATHKAKYNSLPEARISRFYGLTYPEKLMKKYNKENDITDSRLLPAAAMSILGMGMNFIPTPSWTPSPDEVEHSIDLFERDIGLKVHFAGDDGDYGLKKIKKLRIKSAWKAPPPPHQINSRISKFLREIKHLILQKWGKPNPNKFQNKMLSKIHGNHNVIIAHADKGLGPDGIITSKYIRWALRDYLLDTTTYTIVPKDQHSRTQRNCTTTSSCGRQPTQKRYPPKHKSLSIVN